MIGLIVLVMAVLSCFSDRSYASSPKDLINQIDYAGIAAKTSSSPLIAFRHPQGKFAAIIQLRPRDHLPRLVHQEKISTSQVAKTEFDNVFATVISGYEPDANVLKQKYDNTISQHQIDFGEYPSIDAITSELGQIITKGIYMENLKENVVITRPLACGLAIATYDRDRQISRLRRLDNTGFASDCNMIVTGPISQQSEEALHAMYSKHCHRSLNSEFVDELCQFLKDKLLGLENDNQVEDKRPLVTFRVQIVSKYYCERFNCDIIDALKSNLTRFVD